MQGTELATETRVCNKKFTHIYTQSVCFFLQFPHLKDKPHVTNLEGMNLFRASSSKSNLIGLKAKGIPWLIEGLSFSSVQFSRSVVSNSLRPHGLQHTWPPCPSPTPRVYSNSCPLSQWCHPTISSSVIPFSSCFQSFPASGSFQMSQLFTSGGQIMGVSASTSVLAVNIQDWFPLGWTG